VVDTVVRVGGSYISCVQIFYGLRKQRQRLGHPQLVAEPEHRLFEEAGSIYAHREELLYR
jgi:hypothetical protein